MSALAKKLVQKSDIVHQERKNSDGEAEARESLGEADQAISRITSGDLKREGFGKLDTLLDILKTTFRGLQF